MGDEHSLILLLTQFNLATKLEVGTLWYPILSIENNTSPRGGYLVQIFLSIQYIGWIAGAVVETGYLTRFIHL